MSPQQGYATTDHLHAFLRHFSFLESLSAHPSNHLSSPPNIHINLHPHPTSTSPIFFTTFILPTFSTHLYHLFLHTTLTSSIISTQPSKHNLLHTTISPIISTQPYHLFSKQPNHLFLHTTLTPPIISTQLSHLVSSTFMSLLSSPTLHSPIFSTQPPPHTSGRRCRDGGVGRWGVSDVALLSQLLDELERERPARALVAVDSGCHEHQVVA